ncbi:hypothetical protein [Roseibium sp. MB-4]
MSAVVGISSPSEDPSPRHVLLKTVEASQKATDAKAPTKAGFGFSDFVDVINPLQHIPGVSNVYRAVTNDQISEDARHAGRTLYGAALGGPVGIGLMMAYDAMTTPGTSSTAQDTLDAEVASVETPRTITAPETPNGDGFDSEGAPMISVSSPILGETVASAGERTPGTPFNLLQFGELSEDAVPAPKPSNNDSTERVPEPGRISTGDAPGADQSDTKTVVPSSDDLGRLAEHESNHLSLDVLKALQERHAKLSAS